MLSETPPHTTVPWAFFERFTRTVGLPPMEYLLAWRMGVAKDLLRRHDFGLAEVAERVG